MPDRLLVIFLFRKIKCHSCYVLWVFHDDDSERHLKVLTKQAMTIYGAGSSSGSYHHLSGECLPLKHFIFLSKNKKINNNTGRMQITKPWSLMGIFQVFHDLSGGWVFTLEPLSVYTTQTIYKEMKIFLADGSLK